MSSRLRNKAAAARGRGVCCAAQLQWQCHGQAQCPAPAQMIPRWVWSLRRFRFGASLPAGIAKAIALRSMGTSARAGEPDRPVSRGRRSHSSHTPSAVRDLRDLMGSHEISCENSRDIIGAHGETHGNSHRRSYWRSCQFSSQFQYKI